MLVDSGIDPIRLPARSPNLNAYVERFIRSIREECLDRMIFFGVRSLRRAISQYVTHYQVERPHQGLESEMIEPGVEAGRTCGAV